MGGLARAGKVKRQTPKVEKQEKAKKKTGRAKKRAQYNRRFVNVVSGFGKKREGQEENWTSQEESPIQPTICKRCLWFWKEKRRPRRKLDEPRREPNTTDDL